MVVDALCWRDRASKTFIGSVLGVVLAAIMNAPTVGCGTSSTIVSVTGAGVSAPVVECGEVEETFSVVVECFVESRSGIMKSGMVCSSVCSVEDCSLPRFDSVDE